MPRLSYKGYLISCKPIKSTNDWQLEIEKSGREIVHTWSINPSKTLKSIENFAFDQIDTDIDAAKKRDDKTTSLAMRRFQFLLMGAS